MIVKTKFANEKAKIIKLNLDNPPKTKWNDTILNIKINIAKVELTNDKTSFFLRHKDIITSRTALIKIIRRQGRITNITSRIK